MPDERGGFVTGKGIHIRRAEIGDLEPVASLFDAYRQFYRQPPDREGALRFIRERLIEADSHILLAEFNGTAAGFVQLFPSYSSVRLGRLMILNDLYVAETVRGQGVGRALLEAACGLARQAGAAGLVLETEQSNETAQRLYEASGWKRSRHVHYG
ncbi:MAG: N-acetyltransferase family protein, partial [Alphaproteobacteria bacterium]